MKERTVSLGEGAGGELMQSMLKELVLPLVRTGAKETGTGIPASLLDDSATVGDAAFTIDGHTVWPLEFPGGDIGSLSVYGTVNDLCAVGARPEALALSLVIEEGMEKELLKRISASIGSAADRSGVTIVTGDTKVVEKGGVKGMIATTAGLGWKHPLLDDNLYKAGREPGWLRDDSLRSGDSLILTGPVGDHGISLLSFREGYGFETEVVSDLAPMVEVMDRVLGAGGVVAAKDLTRGGVANALNEWSSKNNLSLNVVEEKIPVREPVRSACDLLGLDPFEIGNEGKMILAVAPGFEDAVLSALRSCPMSKDSEIIGTVLNKKGPVVLETVVGGRRIMDPPHGDPVPRIC
ncbi:MAG: hydrogenase expression/formation protein HypE [Thermoplasmatota archaeon]